MHPMPTAKRRGRRAAAAPTSLLLLCVAAAGAASVPEPQIDRGLAPAEIEALAADAFFWGMQQVGFYELRYLFTQAEENPAFRGESRVQHSRNLFTAKQRYATTPNASTLYSGGVFALGSEPVIVTTQAVTDGRYWSVQAADQYAHYFFFVGSPFTGNDAQRYLIVGPRWRGTLPPGFRGREVVRAPSDSITLTLRLAVRDADDPQELDAAHRVMEGAIMTPLSLWERNGRLLVPLAEQPIVRGRHRSFPRMAEIGDLTRSMTPMDYFQLVSLVINDPSLTKREDSVKEARTLARLARIGLREGHLFDPDAVNPVEKKALQDGFFRARREARDAFERGLIEMNGWKLQTSLAYDENDYALRAGAAEIAWGSPVPFQSHTIAFGLVDADGQALDGRHRYTLTFDLAELPPVTEFWEIPLYDAYGYLVDNPIDRYSVTSFMLAAGKLSTGRRKLVLHLQSKRPRDPEQARNWLPTPPEGAFRLAPRFYGPTSGLIDGTYPMPRIERVE